ncbi:MAG TPA: nucleoside-diphosphate sugar epimerase/dehydratase [Paludibacteraceae bacterium]|nr:nucleoside-diphosphate sugar epimerase/dehydratase [Paludibacteraceae bacterium]HPT42760.1 nucleoside-diphosphate sugar epimerase/dehydratase [Paludibacteraceae bacterium]
MSLRYLPRWLVLSVDIVVCIIAFVISYLIAVNLSVTHNQVLALPFTSRLSLLLLFQVIFFWFFHTYSGILRYSGYVDAAKLLLAVFSNAVLLVILNLLFISFLSIHLFYYESILFYSVISFFLLFIIRLAVKTIYDYISQNSGISIPIMIYGTKSAGIAIAKMIRTNENVKYKLVGFVDDDKNSVEKIVMGVKVYKKTEENVKKIISKKAKAIIVSPLKLQTINPQIDLDIFLNNKMSVLITPPMSIWDGDKMPSPKQIKSIQIEDLLERPQIKISTENISSVINNKVILITGAAGSIGSEIARQLTSFKPQLIVLVDQAETPMHNLILKLKEQYPKQDFSSYLGDIRNLERMKSMMEIYRPDIVFHAAAYKHVPLMEDNPTESIQDNVLGTKNIADLSLKYGVSRFVMVSTDKAVNPTNVMGASKRIAEIYVQSLNKKQEKEDGAVTRFITTRFGNVLGSNGSVIPHFKQQIEKGGPVTVTHPDIIRYFMTIPEACLLVLEAGTMGNGGEIYIFDMGEPVKILDLAKKMIRLAGYIPDVDIPISFTGLRPGEKLYEELLNKKEITQKTHHPKIMIATVREYDFDDISQKINELITYSYLGKNFLTVSQMKSIVPEFISNNSQYERLDVENIIAE